METLLNRLIAEYPEVRFVEGSSYYWSPSTQQVFYSSGQLLNQVSDYSLLHELSHALLDHISFKSDYELLLMEMAAWEHAKKLSKKYAVSIDDDHVQDCLDSYRDWVYRRSICSRCGAKSLQCDKNVYQCFNCHNSWHVTSSRMCRPYRHNGGIKKPSATSVADGLS